MVIGLPTGTAFSHRAFEYSPPDFLIYFTQESRVFFMSAAPWPLRRVEVLLYFLNAPFYLVFVLVGRGATPR